MIDPERVASLLKKEKPKIVVLGATVFLFPHPVKIVSEIVHSYDGRLIYDGSHVMGLIAGRSFQDPLDEGADLLLGSTHKTLFGPQGGIILSNDEELLQNIEGRFLYRFIDNFHLSHIAGLGVALEEIQLYGKVYSKKVRENSKALATSLDRHGLPVAGRSNGFTESHQVLMNFGDSGVRIREALESNGIIVDSRVRLGTNEVTRRKMGTKQMGEIADLVSETLSIPSSLNIRKRVFNLSSQYQEIGYTLKERFSTKFARKI